MRRLRAAIDKHGFIFAVVCIAAATVVFLPGRDYFAKGQWALLYLLLIGLVAGLSGFKPALLASVLAFLAWNYFFLPPYNTFRVHDPKDWLFLLVFLIVGVAMGLQTSRMREREAQARSREQEMAFLNEFSAHLVSEESISDLVDLLLTQARRLVGAKCATLFLVGESGELYEAQSPSTTKVKSDEVFEKTADWAYRESKAVGLPLPMARAEAGVSVWPISVSLGSLGITEQRHDVFIPLQTESQQVGVLHIGERLDGKPYSLRDAQLMMSIANLTTAFLERKHLHSLAIQADALREADRLKSTFVSSVSHELKTPLASITALVTSILEGDVAWDEPTIRGELEAVKDDLDRLDSSISSLVDFSRLESDAWKPRMDWYELGEILGTTLSRIPEAQRSRISFLLPEDLPTVYVDFVQISRVLANLLENALTYSEGSAVRIGASSEQNGLRIWVEDEGPGIPSDERERIFDKFYRGATSTIMPSGTGLGLAIAAEIVRFHGGRMWVEDIIPHGTRMVVFLPKEPEK
jgi:two-component system sensor histidine kinase KdpD